MRAIDADAFAEFLKDAVKRQKYEDTKIDGLLTVADVIEAVISELDGTSLDGFKNAPTIELRCEECEAFNKTRLLIPQPERKKGKWTKDCACEICGFKPWYERDIHTLSFCPNCGADMRGDNDDQSK